MPNPPAKREVVGAGGSSNSIISTVGETVRSTVRIFSPLASPAANPAAGKGFSSPSAPTLPPPLVPSSDKSSQLQRTSSSRLDTNTSGTSSQLSDEDAPSVLDPEADTAVGSMSSCSSMLDNGGVSSFTGDGTAAAAAALDEERERRGGKGGATGIRTPSPPSVAAALGSPTGDTTAGAAVGSVPFPPSGFLSLWRGRGSFFATALCFWRGRTVGGLSVGGDPAGEEEAGDDLGLAATMGATGGLGRGVSGFGVSGDGDRCFFCSCCCHPIVFAPAVAVAVAVAAAVAAAAEAIPPATTFFFGLGPPAAAAGRFWSDFPPLSARAPSAVDSAAACFAGPGVWLPFGPLF